MPETTIAEYSKTNAALAGLRERYEGASYDVATKNGMADAREARADLRQWRTDLEEERVRIKAPALARSRAIDSEAKRIATELRKLEDPIDATIKEETGRKRREQEEAERVDAERIATIKERISDLDRWPLAMVGCGSDEIQTAVRSLEGISIDADAFGEFTEQATAVHTESLRKVTELHTAALDAEKQKAELERLQEDQAERAREEQARVAEEVRARADAEAESRRKIEEAERASRERIEAEEREARQTRERAEAKIEAGRLAKEKAERVEREKADDVERKKREKIEEAERAKRRKECEASDAIAMLETFVRRFGDVEAFAPIARQISEYLKGAK